MRSLEPWLPLALALLVALAFGHRFENDWVFDDEDVIRDGALVHDPGRILEAWTHHTLVASRVDPGLQPVDTYRPLPITSFALDAQLSGRDPWAFHLTSLLLHLGCVLLVFALARLWLGAPWPAFYGAAVFALHPWGVEAHVWINGRSDPLALLFGLGAMALVLLAERRGDRRLLVPAGLSLTLGLFAKETLLLALPAILVMPAARGDASPLRDRLAPRLACLALPAALYLGARSWVLGGMRTHRDADMLFEAGRNLPWLLFDALRQAIAPSIPYLRSLRDEYADLAPWQIGLAAVVVLAVCGLAWRARARAPLAAWSLLWFLPPLVPVAIITTALWPGFGRYLYLPVAGLAWALAELVAKLGPSRRALVIPLAGAHLLALGGLAWLYTASFRDSASLYGDAIAARPEQPMAHGFWGLTLWDERDAAAAIPPLARAVELDPGEHRYRIILGRALLAEGRREEAAAVAESGIALHRGRQEEAPYHLLAVNAMSAPDPERAVRHLVRCLDVWPGRVDCERALSFLLTEAPDAEHNRAVLRRLRPTDAPR